MLKLDYGKEIDMWSLGCILFTLLTRLLLIKGKSEVDCMNRIVQVLGMPPKSMIAKSKVWNTFFETGYNNSFELQNKVGIAPLMIF